MQTRADRYLEREVLSAFTGTLAILLLVILGGLLTDVLNKIARGKVPAQLLLSQIGLRIPDALTLLLPLAALIAVLMAYGRLYRDSEMAVLAASGYGPLQTVRPLLRLGAVLVFLQAALALVIAPYGRAVAAQMIKEVQNSLAVAGLASGRFVELPGGGGVLYVSSVSEDQTTVSDVLLIREREGRRLVLSAKTGQLSVSDDGQTMHLTLAKGERIDGTPGEPGYRAIQFEQADISFPRTRDAEDSDPRQARSTLDLWRSSDAESRAELMRRLAQPVVLGMLLLLAPILAQGQPRQPRYDKLILAIFLYISYSNLTEISRVWLLSGTTPAWLGTWWVHVGFIGVVLGAWAHELLAWWRGRRLLARMGLTKAGA